MRLTDYDRGRGMRPVIDGLPVWTDSAGVTHTDEACKRIAPGHIWSEPGGWLCTSCVLVEVVPATTRRHLFGTVSTALSEQIRYGDWRDGRSHAAVRMRRALKRLAAEA